MRLGSTRMRSLFVLRLAVLGGLLAVAVVAIGGAVAAPSTSTKYYSVDMDPTVTARGSTAAHLVTLTNSDQSTQTLGSANVGVPGGFSIVSVSSVAAPAGKTWSVAYSAASGALELRASSSSSALAPGESVGATVTVATSCAATSSTWPTRAKQANNFSGPPGNDFVRLGDDPFVTVTDGGGTAVALRFVQQPSRAQVNTAIAPAVSVEAVDACGFRATGASGAQVGLSLSTNPTGAGLTGNTANLASGLATFPALAVDTSGIGYQLSAAATGLTGSGPSSAFDVVDRLCVFGDEFCEASDAGGTTTVTTDGPPQGGTMTLTFTGLGSQIACGAGALDVRGSITIIDPEAYTAPIAVTGRWNKSVAPGTGVANFVFCMSKDGQTYKVVPACTRSGRIPQGESFCELKRNRDGVGDLLIWFLIAPNDPYVGLG